jgi:IS5 family transposase
MEHALITMAPRNLRWFLDYRKICAPFEFLSVRRLLSQLGKLIALRISDSVQKRN